MAIVDDLCDPADEDRSCQQCGRPIHWSETLCDDCRWGVALAPPALAGDKDAEAQADDGQDATPPEGAALTDEELPALRARCAELVHAGPESSARLVDALRRQLAGGGYGD